MSVVIEDRRSLAAARHAVDEAAVTLDTSRLKARNLLPLALRTAYWSVAPGGTIEIIDRSPDRAGPAPFDLTRGLVRQWAFKFIGAGCRLLDLTDERIVLERTAPLLAPGWSAGIVFSGNDAEIPALLACLAGLSRQPELSPEVGGEIIVCGPARPMPALNGLPGVRYLAFETAAGPRFMIGQKKNALMAALANPRMVILHTRIVLSERALTRVPREFDIASPDTYVASRRGRTRYLSLIQSDAVAIGTLPRQERKLMRDVVSGDPLELIERGPVFVDGGAFYVTKPVFEACPLHHEIAWNEGEDVEWCGRAYADGFVSELAIGSDAVSATSKLGDWSKLGPVEMPVRSAAVAVRTLRGRSWDAVQRFLGQR